MPLVITTKSLSIWVKLNFKLFPEKPYRHIAHFSHLFYKRCPAYSSPVKQQHQSSENVYCMLLYVTCYFAV